jgi:hypothetical protein
MRSSFLQQTDDTAMENSLYAVLSNSSMKHFEELALDIAQLKLLLWLQYVNNNISSLATWPGQIKRFLQPHQ